ncbi:FAD-dependent oxidoreductase [Conexibacter sp. CPCC 206217]|uniref:FAD-dependent oxidoreductase n=1 Tax=Conexibacter sp. CPCC 206217 TaxID=3064574 RepID=UPI00272755C7|nr:FAD-dependent oxidoreductase [Conexibacter sp. CPCC 206217]MDO8212562.1 FAD-dependent oxidoreductase [Conexibacter sp. CPCC 206217]
MERPVAPLRVAVVGSGPAGFYAAGQLLRALPGAEVEMFDRLPTPWGLVRAGVAPDHPNIKAVTRVFEKTASQPGFRFHGNVTVGRDVSHAELAAHCHAVLYAVGAPADRRLGIPGEELPGSLAATAFVGWYNGHPDYADLDPDLSCRRAVVVGNGNVALDVARMLVLGREALGVTDVADHALELLGRSAVEEVVVLGRRGPAQAAFTDPELEELGALADVDLIVRPEELALDPASAAWLDSDAASETARRNVALLRELAGRVPQGRRKRIELRFLASPLEIVGDGRVEGVRISRNALDAQQRAQPIGWEETLAAGLVLRSVGYRGEPVPGLPFDERRATIANERGRVVDPASGAPVAGAYTAGWIKRGPSGIIGTNKKCAQETVTELLADHAAGLLPTPQAGAQELLDLLHARNPDVVDYAGWELIDAHEREAGAPAGRPRVKVVRQERFLQLAGQRKSGED